MKQLQALSCSHLQCSTTGMLPDIDTAPASHTSPFPASALVQPRDQHGPEPAPSRDRQTLPPQFVGVEERRL